MDDPCMHVKGWVTQPSDNSNDTIGEVNPLNDNEGITQQKELVDVINRGTNALAAVDATLAAEKVAPSAANEDTDSDLSQTV